MIRLTEGQVRPFAVLTGATMAGCALALHVPCVIGVVALLGAGVTLGLAKAGIASVGFMMAAAGLYALCRTACRKPSAAMRRHVVAGVLIGSGPMIAASSLTTDWSDVMRHWGALCLKG